MYIFGVAFAVKAVLFATADDKSCQILDSRAKARGLAFHADRLETRV